MVVVVVVAVASLANVVSDDSLAPSAETWWNIYKNQTFQKVWTPLCMAEIWLAAQRSYFSVIQCEWTTTFDRLRMPRRRRRVIVKLKEVVVPAMSFVVRPTMWRHCWATFDCGSLPKHWTPYDVTLNVVVAVAVVDLVMSAVADADGNHHWTTVIVADVAAVVADDVNAANVVLVSDNSRRLTHEWVAATECCH